jgi:methionyl-tRNA formyltransferase
MGTPDFAVASLKMLLESKYDIAAVVTATDKFGGRGGNQLLQSDVKKFAVEHKLRIIQPEKLKAKKFIEELKEVNADIFVVVAFRMLPEIIWNLPRYGTINVHGSLLPKFRGAAPINWAIIGGEKETGVTTFKLDHEIDTGAILGQKKCSIEENDDFGTMYEKMKVLGAELLIETLNKIEKGESTYQQQDDSLASHAPKIFHETCKINFNKSVEEVNNFIRGLSPYPAAHFDFLEIEMKVFKAEIEIVEHKDKIGCIRTDKKKFLKVACINGYIHLLDIKLEGKKRMKIGDFLNGYRFNEAQYDAQ